MPTYEYRCDANDRVVEVSHKMTERLSTWAELCHRAGLDPGRAAGNAAVTKLISGTFISTRQSADRTAPPCKAVAPCCGGRLCDIN